MPDSVVDLARQLKRKLELRETISLRRIIEAYAEIKARLADEIEALNNQIRNNPNITKKELMRLSWYKRLMRDTEDELGKYQQYLSVTVSQEARNAIALGTADATRLMRTLGVDASLLGKLDTDTIERIVGFLDKNGKLYKKLEALPGEVADKVSNAIVQSVALGRNPVQTAYEINNAFGMGLTDSLRTVRTAQLWAYRESTRANYVASGVITGWQWMSALDDRVCSSCLAMHGTKHSLDETLNDHFNGRCVMIPVIGEDDNILESGKDWFDAQPETRQAQIVGASKLAAYRRGDFDFSALSRVETSDIYGDMRSETPLKDLIGDK